MRVFRIKRADVGCNSVKRAPGRTLRHARASPRALDRAKIPRPRAPPQLIGPLRTHPRPQIPALNRLSAGAVGGEGDVEARGPGGGGRQPVVDVGADEAGRDVGVGGQLPRTGDRLVADVDAGDPSAEAGERQGVLADVALQMHEVEAGERTCLGGHICKHTLTRAGDAGNTEQREIVGEQRGTSGAQEAGLVALVAVVGRNDEVPGPPVLLVGLALHAPQAT